MKQPRIVVVGAGFAGLFCARALERELPAGAAELTVVSDTDHLCYSPLLPEVAAASLEPRRIAVPLHAALRRSRILQGIVESVDLDAKSITVARLGGTTDTVDFDRLVLTVGSVTRTFDTPGLLEHAWGLKTLTEATYLRDHVLTQLELADATADPAERAARCTFVVVGAGYAGTETAAQLQRLTQQAVAQFPRLRPSDVRWFLLDAAERVLPELGPGLGDRALDLVRRRGMHVRLGVTLKDIRADGVTLDDGSNLATHTVLWCAGVAAAPLVATLGLPTRKGRLVVNDHLQVPDHPDVFAAGDAAAVPDLTKDPDDGQRPLCPPTAQHAQRQGAVLGRNVAASVGHGTAKPYVHHDLGLVADLGGWGSVARPLGLPLWGIPAKIVTKGYHLYALPAMGNRVRVAADWLVGLVSPPPVTQLGFVGPEQARLDAERRVAR